MVIISLGGKLPYPSSDLPEDSAGHCNSSYLVLLQVGFAKLVGHPTTGRLLSCHFTFARHNNIRLCIFCSTFLEVTLTGYYPALCPAELGLSSKEDNLLPRLPDLLFLLLKDIIITIKSQIRIIILSRLKSCYNWDKLLLFQLFLIDIPYHWVN